jgi:hypothetical protein
VVSVFEARGRRREGTSVTLSVFTHRRRGSWTVAGDDGVRNSESTLNKSGADAGEERYKCTETACYENKSVAGSPFFIRVYINTHVYTCMHRGSTPPKATISAIEEKESKREKDKRTPRPKRVHQKQRSSKLPVRLCKNTHMRTNKQRSKEYNSAKERRLKIQTHTKGPYRRKRGRRPPLLSLLHI